METNKKPRKGHNLIAFVLGIILGKKGIPVFIHFIYLTIIILAFFFGQLGFVSTYATAIANTNLKDKVRAEVEKDLDTTCNVHLHTLKNRCYLNNKFNGNSCAQGFVDIGHATWGE